jgi:uncharacterized protein (TIGR02266 family)
MTQNEQAAAGERRRSKRYKASLRVLFQRSESTHFIDAETDNISMEGVYVWTRRRPLDVGTNVSLLLHIEGIDRDLMLDGVVTWVNQKQPSGMGIRFADIESETREILSGALDALQEVESGAPPPPDSPT